MARRSSGSVADGADADGTGRHGRRARGTDRIVIRGAREHNLKGVDLDLPRNRLIVVSGPSGSGKSSLAFDTVFAEGQRRYVESLSAYARQFWDGWTSRTSTSSTAFRRRSRSSNARRKRNPRSTVGTVDRDLRLPAAPVRPHRPPALRGVRSGHQRAVDRPDRRRHRFPARRFADHSAGAGGARPQGAAPCRVRGRGQGGIRAGARGRPHPLPRRCTGAGPEHGAHDRDRGRPSDRSAGPAPAGGRLGGNGAGGGLRADDRAARRRRRRRTGRAAILADQLVRGLRRAVPGARATAVLVQQPARRLP